jgi:56kDa selenium binding protein (SBP56)
MQGGAARPETTDPTFYRSPAEAIAAPPERLAYVAAYCYTSWPRAPG